jgi:hypothetical protein
MLECTYPRQQDLVAGRCQSGVNDQTYGSAASHIVFDLVDYPVDVRLYLFHDSIGELYDSLKRLVTRDDIAISENLLYLRTLYRSLSVSVQLFPARPATSSWTR